MGYRTRYRLNFGNGQVFDADGTRAGCLRALVSIGDGYSFVEWQDSQTGEWFPLRGTR